MADSVHRVVRHKTEDRIDVCWTDTEIALEKDHRWIGGHHLFELTLRCHLTFKVHDWELRVGFKTDQSGLGPLFNDFMHRVQSHETTLVLRHPEAEWVAKNWRRTARVGFDWTQRNRTGSLVEQTVSGPVVLATARGSGQILTLINKDFYGITNHGRPDLL